MNLANIYISKKVVFGVSFRGSRTLYSMEYKNILNHPVVILERVHLERIITRLEAWLIVTSGSAFLFAVILLIR